MAADIETISFVMIRAANATDHAWIRLEDDARLSVLAQLIRGREPGRAPPGDHRFMGCYDGDTRRIFNAGPAMGNERRRKVSECGFSAPMSDSSS